MWDDDAAPVATVLFHVTLTLAGPAVETDGLHGALDRLVQQRPFMLSVRYAADRAELRYWDEAENVDDAAALALRLWGDHRVSAGLPLWTVVGLEVLDRETVHARFGGPSPNLLVAAGVSPL